jgi:hypothetical protein
MLNQIFSAVIAMGFWEISGALFRNNYDIKFGISLAIAGIVGIIFFSKCEC